MKNVKVKMLRAIMSICVISLIMIMWNCSDSTSPESAQGQIMITMVDSPADYDEINIAVTRVEVHRTDADSTNGWIVINNNAAVYDLLTLTNGASVVLGDNYLDAGHYSQIRLIIGTGSNIVVNGITHSLDTPGGIESGVKLNHAFEIEAGLVYELLLDFDAGHSIIQTGAGQYKLKPVIRVVPVVISGTISGSINPISSLATVFAINGTDTVSTFADITTGSFKLMALIQGTYTVNIVPANTTYKDSTITNIQVIAEQNTDLAAINLSLR
ncbi:MAG: DUF4382 domain-containing protein [Bacteroidetes bacterium]|nr:DUF4382 domain-containing protein [Bacteroidota bacterium]